MTCLLFSGIGTTFLDEEEVQALYVENSVFKETLDEINAIFSSISPTLCVRDIVLRIRKLDISLLERATAIFAFHCSLFKLLEQLTDIRAIASFSVGEVSGGYCCGALSLSDACEISYRLAQTYELLGHGWGSMLVTFGISFEEAEQNATQFNVDVGAYISKRGVVFSGETSNLKVLEAHLNTTKTDTDFMAVMAADASIPFHSRFFDRFEESFKEDLKQKVHKPLVLPWYSSVTGARVHEIDVAEHFWKNARDSAFSFQCLTHAINDGYETFLEMSAKNLYARSAMDVMKDRNIAGFATSCFNVDEKQISALQQLKNAISQLG